MNWHIDRLESCASTQDEAAARARAGAPDGTVVVATRMEDGRGTHGRAWHAPEGGLYLSMVLRGLPSAQFLTLALGNAVADVLEVAGADVRLKWVNDVLVEGKKIAGVLVEAESTGDRLDFCIAGMGINVNGSAKDWPHPVNGLAITLQDVLGADQCIPDLETFLLQSVAGWLAKVRAGRGDEVVAAWRARDALRGHRVGIDPDGDLCVKVLGRAEGIDAAGRLLVGTDDGVQAFDNGSVTLLD